MAASDDRILNVAEMNEGSRSIAASEPLQSAPMIGLYQLPPAEYRPYDQRVTNVAQSIAASIERCCPGTVVEHIGSTAVPGCAGKGIVDLMLLYREGQLVPARDALDALGFQRQTGRDPFPEDRPMRVGSVSFAGMTFNLHVHVIAANSPEAAELRAFRDHLRADPTVIAAYVAKKQAILASGCTDPVDYCLQKGEFVQKTLRQIAQRS